MSENNKIQQHKFEAQRGDQTISFETGKLAKAADGSVLISLGEIALLVTACTEKNPDPNKDFMPLTIDFRETFYAGGKIGGPAYNKREGRPSDIAILNSRLIDRPIRPMFPSGMVNDTMVTITTLSTDKLRNPGMLGIIGTSLALMLSGLPFEGPVGAARIGYLDGKFIVNPTYEQIDNGMLELVVAGSKDTVTMVECGAKQVSEEILMQAFEIALDEIKKVCELQEQFLAQCNIVPQEITTNIPSEELIAYVKKILTYDKFHTILPASKNTFGSFQNEITKEILSASAEQIADPENMIFTESKVKIAIFKIFKEYIRSLILKDKKRLDGRGLDEVRPISCEVGLFERLHGSSLFNRGETQAFASVTLGAPGDKLLLDTMEFDMVEKRYMHYYNMLPFSNGEARPYRGASRREVGHGRLSEKALEYVLPSEELFPYTIRTVTEILGSNGSTSMASVCSCTLALMDAGVPISDPVSGIAMGLVSDPELGTQILTDIQGQEDFCGDMDFKVAGTKNGITALQMDMKIKGLSLETIRSAIQKANIGRKHILDIMLATLAQPRENMNPHAPKIITMKINPAQVKDVIGPGGATITDIIKQTGVKIDFKDDGTCIITANNENDAQSAIKIITDITRVPKEGDVVTGTITRVESYGVFVSLCKNKVGLCHVKQLGTGFVPDPKTIYKEGEKMTVKVVGIDQDGKIQLKKEI